MRLSTRGRYAVMAMAEMAARERDAAGAVRPVTLAEIAGAQMLSVAYLEQLFGRLRRAGLVVSARGPGGGYRLARPASAIAIDAVVDAVDEPIIEERGGPDPLDGRHCPTRDLWDELGEQIRLFLGGVTLAEVVEGRVRGRAHPPHPVDDGDAASAQAVAQTVAHAAATGDD